MYCGSAECELWTYQELSNLVNNWHHQQFRDISSVLSNTLITGHCRKFYAMLERAYKMEHINSKPWVVITDDDTIMK